MKLFFLDDARQRNCARERMGDLVGVGGISIDDKAVRPLELAIEALCTEAGFPDGEVFKWSPDADHWMRKGLVEDKRTAFFEAVLKLAASHGAMAQVTIADTTKKMATRRADNHEMDVLIMALERLDAELAKDDLAMAIVARPSGGRKDEDKFLGHCVEIVTKGTEYRSFNHLVTNVLTMPFPNSRMLQVADLVVSITTAMVAGHERFAGASFPHVKPMFRSSLSRIGGPGVKIHPDYSYANLYHWVLGDTHFWTQGNGIPMPLSNRPYARNGMEH